MTDLEKLLQEACQWIDTTLRCESLPPLSLQLSAAGFSKELLAWWREHRNATVKRLDDQWLCNQDPAELAHLHSEEDQDA